MKPAILCLSKKVLTDNHIPVLASGIYHFKLDKVPLNNYHFINRDVLDDKEDLTVGKLFPHIIGYVTVKCGNKYLSYSRKTGGETRLHGSLSIGLGGHTDIQDVVLRDCGSIDGLQTLISAIERELFEEIGLDVTISDIKPDSVIYDTSNEVGQVHLGIPLTVEINNTSEVIKSDEVSDLQWRTKEELLADLEFYENWSKFVIQSL